MTTGHGTLVTSWPLAAGARYPTHVHPAHQLSVATGGGAIALEAEGRTWIVLADRALWIPAGVEHSVDALGPAEMTTLWLDPARCPIGWDRTAVVGVDALVRLLVDRLLDPALAHAARTRSEAVLFDVLRPVDADVLDLPLPGDDRARRVAEALRLLLTDRPIAAIAGDVGYATASAFGAAFRSVTGVTPSTYRRR